MEIEQMIRFFEVCTIVNFAILVLATLILTILRKQVLTFHSKLINLSEDSLSQMYMSYLANYKLLFFVFNVVPYIALKSL